MSYSEFVVTQGSESTRAPARSEPENSQRCALIVEPSTSLARLLNRMVRSFGFRVIEASGADQALAIVEEHGPNLQVLITELSLEGVNGPTLAAFILSRCPRAGVVFLCDEAVPEQTTLPPAAALLLKPFTRKQLLDTINLINAGRLL